MFSFWVLLVKSDGKQQISIICPIRHEFTLLFAVHNFSIISHEPFFRFYLHISHSSYAHHHFYCDLAYLEEHQIIFELHKVAVMLACASTSSPNYHLNQQAQSPKMSAMLTNILQIFKWNNNLTKVLLYVCISTKSRLLKLSLLQKGIKVTPVTTKR